jgi:hypothetical protein
MRSGLSLLPPRCRETAHRPLRVASLSISPCLHPLPHSPSPSWLGVLIDLLACGNRNPHSVRHRGRAGRNDDQFSLLGDFPVGWSAIEDNEFKLLELQRVQQSHEQQPTFDPHPSLQPSAGILGSARQVWCVNVGSIPIPCPHRNSPISTTTWRAIDIHCTVLYHGEILYDTCSD